MFLHESAVSDSLVNAIIIVKDILELIFIYPVKTYVELELLSMLSSLAENIVIYLNILEIHNLLLIYLWFVLWPLSRKFIQYCAFHS